MTEQSYTSSGPEIQAETPKPGEPVPQPAPGPEPPQEPEPPTPPQEPEPEGEGEPKVYEPGSSQFGTLDDSGQPILRQVERQQPTEPYQVTEHGLEYVEPAPAS